MVMYILGLPISPANPIYRPEPNDCLNEVHIPVINVPNPFRIPAHNHPIRRNQPQYRQWKWIAAGAGAYWVN